jgi:EAL domain-containing protein (putative c-di-GMP-specific phosphodiesterase class I)
VQLHIDDFGTGYSSLSYLQRFSYDTLKIDKSFIKDLQGSNGSSAIVHTIVRLGEMLEMNVVAEGVESEDQLAALKEMNCPEAQGFWFSRPIPASEADSLLCNQPLPALS